MDTESIIVIGVIVVAAFLTIAVAGRLLVWGLAGAAFLFAFAAESGFVGIAAYVACWVFMLPVMLIACPIVGFFTVRRAMRDDAAAESVRTVAAPDWAEEDRRYEEAKRRLLKHSRG